MRIKHILKSEEFKELVLTGKKYKSGVLGLYAKADDEDMDLTVGVIVSKKVAPRAVTRNRIRRIIYAFYTQERGRITDGTKIVIRVLGKVEKEKRKATAKQIWKELEVLTRQANLTDD